ncbi:DUF2975 domain-containing protein [Mobilicoccus pelagius]|uniref:DUF2975 domain-containing protein n=1 Tax=Mobilicoccus pelagius NBRC 104925 TaxID=1089455 RepID=H5UVL1_9MICO|nr:DUF2975 domain-containing protein [Mobilicoccus pelagius]GAB49769.1 hypothetical protein MOPEL_135_00070 [Mobilicoccus pelagius NBRC 104925]
MARHTTPEDVLAPIEVAMQALLGLMIVWLAFTAIAPLTGAHVGFGAWGDGGIPCAPVTSNGLTINSGGIDGEGHPLAAPPVENLRPGVRLGEPREYLLCRDDMGPLDEALVSVPVLVDWLWTLGFLALTTALVRRGRRDGLFTDAVARGTRRLGWFVLGGAILVALVGGVLTSVETSRLVSDFPVVAGIPGNMHVDWTAIVAGCGVLTVGRILGQAVDMHRDLEGTV